MAKVAPPTPTSVTPPTTARPRCKDRKNHAMQARSLWAHRQQQVPAVNCTGESQSMGHHIFACLPAAM